MTNRINKTDTIQNPMEKPMTSNERTGRSSTKQKTLRERKTMNTGLAKDTLEWLKTCVDTGVLTKEGRRQLKMCLEAALPIDPETAEIKFEYVPFTDPYGVFQHPKDAYVRRQYFARSPGSDIWVYWDDLPDEVEWCLWQKHKETDPGLRDPLSCWPSFCSSRHFRKDCPDALVTENHVRYIELQMGIMSAAEEMEARKRALARRQGRSVRN